MTIARTKEGFIVLSFDSWKEETPKILKKILNWILGFCAAWAVIQNALPFHIPESTINIINRWVIFIPAAYRFFIQWTHYKGVIPSYDEAANDKQ